MPDHPAFLIDRSLGRMHLAAALTDLGLAVHTLASVWGEAAAQDLTTRLGSLTPARTAGSCR